MADHDAAAPAAPAATAAPGLTALWWRADRPWQVQLLRPAAWLFRLLALVARLPYALGLRRAAACGVPVIVVGNLIVGGAGKTPTVIALVRALRAAGREPGVISRGWGGTVTGLHVVAPDDAASLVGDEPWLIRRSCAVPVVIGRDRAAAARALCKAHPAVDVIVSDDGLQHRALARELQLIVFDARGTGNGLLLPAGPLREPLPAALPPKSWVVYNATKPSTSLPGVLLRSSVSVAVPLAAWRDGQRQGAVPIAGLRGPPLLAAAGIAEPERFFRILEAAGLTLRRLPLPDHHPYATLPWPADTSEVVVTEKDAAKLVDQALGTTKVWVVPLDSSLPDTLLAELLRSLPATTRS